jgi:hypothetical protein
MHPHLLKDGKHNHEGCKAHAVENKYFIHYNRNFINHNDYVRFVEYNQKYSKTIFMESLIEKITTFVMDF